MLHILTTAIILMLLLFIYSAVQIARVREMLHAVSLNLGKLKRESISQDQLARKDIGMLNVLRTTSLITLLASAITTGILFYTIIKLNP